MESRSSKLHYDRLGIVTSIACAIHCTILPIIISSLSFFNVELLENKAIEWTMIALALIFGLQSIHHGYKNHHKKLTPVLLFITGMCCLLLNQIFAERFVFVFIPCASLFIISAHVTNIYHCRKSGNCNINPQNIE